MCKVHDYITGVILPYYVLILLKNSTTLVQYNTTISLNQQSFQRLVQGRKTYTLLLFILSAR